MPDDAEFFAQILANPGDDGPRLVYADWLDEHGDIRGQWLRLVCEFSQLPEGSERRPDLQQRIHHLALKIDPDWRAAVSRVAIENCRVEFEFECPKQWGQLQATDDQRIRFCESCQRNVYYCDTLGQARQLAQRGQCIALDTRVVRQPDDLGPVFLIEMTLGRIRPAQIQEITGEMPPPSGWLRRLFGRHRRK